MKLNKVIILFIVVIVCYGILTQIYTISPSTPSLKTADKFADLELGNVRMGDSVNTDVLNHYNCYFNENTKNNLASGAHMANTNYINNTASIANKLNTLTANIDTLMIQLNNDILNNIGENYARAHILNKQREELKQNIDNLPLKNI